MAGVRTWAVAVIATLLLHALLLLWILPHLKSPDSERDLAPLLVELQPSPPLPAKPLGRPQPPQPKPPPPKPKPRPPLQKLEDLIQPLPAEQLSMQSRKSSSSRTAEAPGASEAPAQAQPAPKPPKAVAQPEPIRPPASSSAPAPRPPTRRSASAPAETPQLPADYLRAAQVPQAQASTPKLLREALARLTPPPTPSTQQAPPPPSGNDGPGGGFFTLSRYDWGYESYMGRWAQQLQYAWRNNPPLDYVQGQRPLGGDVFVLVRVSREGFLTTHEVTRRVRSSDEMEHSVLDALLANSQLPPLPDDFDGEELQVHFRFIYPALR
jgi:hypothetical protein